MRDLGQARVEAEGSIRATVAGESRCESNSVMSVEFLFGMMKKFW